MADEARAAWAKSFVAAQAAMPAITKDREADLGKFTYKYADLSSIVEKIRENLASHKLSFAQDVTSENGLVGVATRIYHEAGHVETFGPLYLPGGSDARSAGAGITYARRYALCAALGIAADEDTDGAGVASEEPSWGTPFEHQCPVCRSPVRRVTSTKPKAPKWACSNDNCTGGKGNRPWASWKEDEFENQAGAPTSVPAETASPPPSGESAISRDPATVAEEGASPAAPSSSDPLTLIEHAVTAGLTIKGKRATVGNFVWTARKLAPALNLEVPTTDDETDAGQWWVLQNCDQKILNAVVDYTDLEKVVNGDRQQAMA